MVEVTNLALASKNSYNYKSNFLKSNLKQFQQLDHKEFLKKTTRLKILKENILSSGMEVTDIDKATLLVNNNVRR